MTSDERVVAVVIHRGTNQSGYEVLEVGEETMTNPQIDKWEDVYVVREGEVESLLAEELDSRPSAGDDS